MNQRNLILVIAGGILAASSIIGVVFYIANYSGSKANDANGKQVLNLPTPKAAAGGESAPVEQQSVASQEIQAQLSPSPAPSPSLTPVDGKSDWPIYTKVSAGYTFKYPVGWTLLEGGSACGPVFYSPDSEQIRLTVCGLYTSSDDTPAEMASRAIGSNLSSLVSKTDVTVAGHSAVRQETKPSADQYNIDIYVGDVVGTPSTTKGTLTLSFSIQGASNFTSMKKQFDDILTTFKFTK